MTQRGQEPRIKPWKGSWSGSKSHIFGLGRLQAPTDAVISASSCMSENKPATSIRAAGIRFELFYLGRLSWTGSSQPSGLASRILTNSVA